MNNLDFTKTKDTLEIHFDAETGILLLKGESYPEDPVVFFAPLYDWIEQYIQEISKELTVNIDVNYINTSSSKCLIDFFRLLEEYSQTGGQVKINWYYEEDDEDMQETGEEFFEDLELTYKLIAY